MKSQFEHSLTPQVPVYEDEIDFLSLAKSLLESRRVIAAATLVGAVLSATVCFMLPNYYKASATIMPVDSSNDRLSSALSSFGALSGLASQAGVNIKGSVGDKYVAILRSRTVTESLIRKHNLMPVLFADRWDDKTGTWKSDPFSKFLNPKAVEPTIFDGIRFLDEALETSADMKTGLVCVSIELKDAQVAADIANYYVTELNAFLQHNSLSSAEKNRDFLQKQVDTTLAELGTIESSLKAFQEKHQLVSLDAQAEASVKAYAQLKSQLVSKEIELSLLASSVPVGDVQLNALKQEVAQLRNKTQAIETGSSGGLISFKDAPSLEMQFGRLKRDLLVKQKVFEVLTQQLELAKVEASKEALSFQLVDRAVAPDRKSKPKRLLLILAATFAVFVAASVSVLGFKHMRGATR